MNCLAFFTKFTYPNTAIVSVKCSRPAYHPGNITLAPDLITIINTKNVVPITSLHIENVCGHWTFRGHDSHGIRRVFFDFQDISFQPSSIGWDSLPLHHLKYLQVTAIYIPWT